MTKEQDTLWNKIKDFELDLIDSSLTFTDRLARENGWSYEFSIRAIVEYKKFIFLICVCNQPLTPSDEVDQVWHLHLLYTESYWKDLCKDTLNREIHHGPTKGGKSEGLKFNDWYLKTFDYYKEYFNQTPPIDIWPLPKKRFKRTNFKRVDINSFWIIKKPFK